MIDLVLMRELLSDKGLFMFILIGELIHYAKLLLDEIFGYENFINEITWCYYGPGSPNHETI
jgi:adenine specific DNA methylase Mod